MDSHSLFCRITGFADLPQEALIKAIQKVDWIGNEKDLLSLRQVSSACRAAVQEFEGSLSITIKDPDKTLNICHLLPRLSSLAVWSSGIPYKLYPVLACSRLVCLRLENHPTRVILNRMDDLILDLTCLPASLIELQITNYQLHRDSLQFASCPQLTKLALRWTSNTSAEICQYVQHLPHVQVKFLVCRIELCCCVCM